MTTERLICGDCKATFEVENKKISIFGSLFSLIAAIVTFGLFFPRLRKRKFKKKNCDYCGSNFLLPDTFESRELLNPIIKKNNSNF